MTAIYLRARVPNPTKQRAAADREIRARKKNKANAHALACHLPLLLSKACVDQIYKTLNGVNLVRTVGKDLNVCAADDAE